MSVLVPAFVFGNEGRGKTKFLRYEQIYGVIWRESANFTTGVPIFHLDGCHKVCCWDRCWQGMWKLPPLLGTMPYLWLLKIWWEGRECRRHCLLLKPPGWCPFDKVLWAEVFRTQLNVRTRAPVNPPNSLDPQTSPLGTFGEVVEWEDTFLLGLSRDTVVADIRRALRRHLRPCQTRSTRSRFVSWMAWGLGLSHENFSPFHPLLPPQKAIFQSCLACPPLQVPSSLASKWAAFMLTCVLNIVSHYHIYTFHIKIPPQHVSVQRMRRRHAWHNYLRQALYFSLLIPIPCA